MFSLIDDPWIPVIHSDGRRSKIKPEQISDNTISDLDYTRPDFQGAAYQFLIGLLQTTFAPEENVDWDEYWDEIPSQSTLSKAFSQVKHAMTFGANKPAFMQDFDALDSEPNSILGLLIEAPGDNTLKYNKDHFIKRDVVECLCESCAAIALFTLQTNAPAGGQGHRTSMRGGGPITTLIMPEPNNPVSLWHRLWLNVYPQSSVNSAFDATVFPWLAQTKTSDKKNSLVTPESVNELQAYWGMPRRIELDFASTKEGCCHICGEQSDRLLTQYRTKNYGIQYDGWTHPLSPYRQGIKEGSPLLAVKGQPGGLVYRDWLGLISASKDRLNAYSPAKNVDKHGERFKTIRAKSGLWCFGYDMDNRKARCWYEHRFPLVVLNSNSRDEFNELVTLILELATNSLSLLRSTINLAEGNIGSLSLAYWQETETEFLTVVNQLYAGVNEGQTDKNLLLVHWRDYLRNYVFNTFVQRVFSDPDNTETLKKQVEAWLSLRKQFFKQKPIQTINELTGVKQENLSMYSITKTVLLPNDCEPIIYRWFEALQERNQHVFTAQNGRALRAELRRASLFDGVVMSQAHFYLNNEFFKVYKKNTELNQRALIMFAAVAVHANKNDKSASFAAQLSEKVNNGDRSYVSRERFNRLLKANSPEDFTRQLIRAVKLRGDKGVNLFSLADSIFLWMEEWNQKQQNLPADPNPFKRNAVRWATEYFN